MKSRAVKCWLQLALLSSLPSFLQAANVDPLYLAAQKKMDLLDSGRAKRGTTMIFSPAELNAWVRTRTPQWVSGVRDPRLEFGLGAIKGYALLDLAQIRQGQGTPVSPVFAPVISGEKPVKISVRLDSALGKCTVFLDEVQYSGTALSGGLLNFLIQAFFLPMFPDAKIDRPFILRDPMERIEIRPDGVRIFMKK